jgi:phosphoglycerol geranylgeranyltransferase
MTALAILADPDKTPPDAMEVLAKTCAAARVDYLLLGGSLMLTHRLDACIAAFRKHTSIPIVLFPGNPAQVTPAADALLYLSLVSGRNAELLIGQHVTSAAMVRASGLETISTGYLLIDGGVPTTVSYISNTQPIPNNKPEIALATAWAAEMQGKQALYLEAGSGARLPVPVEMIRMVAGETTIPLIVGGGIRTAEKIYEDALAGANLIVVGTAAEQTPALIPDMAAAVRQANGEKK